MAKTRSLKMVVSTRKNKHLTDIY